ncbi:MAG: response regulator [Planctomycetes bacterium]|nr:response regulator [Planctomycetota bacterium]
MTDGVDEVAVLQRRLQREKQRIAILEQVIEDKTRELYLVNETLQQQNQTLEQLVELRTVELRDALGTAQAANQAKSDFLAQMSHELRTPLHGLSGTIDVLGRTTLDERQRELVTLCQQSSGRLLRVIGDVLDWTRIESGKLEIEARPLCLQDQVHQAVQAYAVAAVQKGLTLRVDMPVAPRCLLLGDTHRLGQVLGNLLSNALKFTAKGELSVRVACTTGADGQCTVDWRVADTGCGIPPNALGRMFQPFSQAEAATTRRFGGTGLGLSIVKRIIEAMGGAIRVQSEVGVGTTFTFTTVHKVADKLEEPEPVPTGVSLRGVRALLVDDHPVNRTIGEAMLVELGCSVQLAEDGAESIRKVKASPPDIVLMDCHMPGMTGLQATRKIRYQGFRGPILAVSADVSPDNRDAVVEAGMQGLLGKPFRQEELLRAMVRLLPRAQSGAPATAPVTAATAATASEPAATQAAAAKPLAEFDEAAALELVGGKRGLLVRLCEVWLQHLAASVDAVRTALAGSDAKELQKSAHAVKGAAASVGAARLRALTAELEDAGKAGRLVPERRAELDAVVLATEAAVRAFTTRG